MSDELQREDQNPTLKEPSEPNAPASSTEMIAKKSILTKVKSTTQTFLDKLYYGRDWFGNALVFLSLRLLAVEVTWEDVKDKSLYPEEEEIALDFDRAKEIDALLEVAKDGYKASSDRRTSVIDKTKTLLTVASLFLALIGFLIPKDLAYSAIGQKFLAVITIALFLHAIVLLLMFFTIGNEMSISLDQESIELEETDLKKSLAASYHLSRITNDRRTDYLVEVFKAARFSIFAAFVTAIILFGYTFFSPPPRDQATEFIRKLRGDRDLIELTRGPKGEKGDAGPTGDRGPQGPTGKIDIDQLAEQVAKRLKEHR